MFQKLLTDNNSSKHKGDTGDCEKLTKSFTRTSDDIKAAAKISALINDPIN